MEATKSIRQRHVFATHEIPHLWAHKTQSDARNSQGNLYFENETIYSYGSHFPIARHYENKKGERCVLFTTRTYSVTTSAHCSHVRQSIPSSVPVFNVPIVAAGSVSGSLFDKHQHAENLTDYVKRIDAAILKSARARSSWQKESSHNGALAMSNDCRAYAKFFRVPCPKLPAVPAIDSEAMAAVRKAEASKAAKRAEETRRENEERIKRQAHNAEQWRLGLYHGGFDYGFPTMLRLVTSDGEPQVETSRGARVPVEHAKRALEFVRKVRASGVEWRTNGHQFHIGVYSIDRVTVDGELHAGCHVISYSEIERIAPALEQGAQNE